MIFCFTMQYQHELFRMNGIENAEGGLGSFEVPKIQGTT